MKKKVFLLFSLLLVSNFSQLFSAKIIKEFLQKPTKKKEIIVFGVTGKAEKQLANLKKVKENLKNETKSFTESINKQIAETTSNIKAASLQLRQEPENIDFINNKISLLNETYQALKDIQLYRKQLSDSLDEHIKLLEEYLNDPDFKEYIKEYRVQKRFYNFDDLQILHENILSQEKRISSLEGQLKNANIELENREQSAAATRENHEKKSKERETFMKNPEKAPIPADMFALNNQQKLELLSFQENLLQAQKKLEEYRLRETRDKVSLIGTKIFIAKLKLTIIKKAAKSVKPTIKISESDIATDKAKLDRNIKEATRKDVGYNTKIEEITRDKDIKSKQLEQLSKQLGVLINIELDKWSIDPTTAEEYINMLKVGVSNEFISSLKRKKELIEAQKSRDAEQLAQNKAQINIKETFYKIINKKFGTEEEITKATNKYSTSKADIKARIARFSEKKKAASDQLDIKNKALENIKELKGKIEREKNNIFRYLHDYNNCLNYLKNAEKLINEQINLLKKIIGIYENIIKTNTNSAKQVDFIISELEVFGWAYRPEYALKWEDVKSIFPEMGRFVSDLRSYIVQFSFVNSFEKVKLTFPTTLDFILFIIKLTILFLVLLLFRMYAPLIHKKSIAIARKYKGFRFLGLFTSFILEFAINQFMLIAIWIMLFATVKLRAIPDDYINIFFYLLSIPYFFYLANRFFALFVSFNERHGYALLAKKLQSRLLIAFSIILHSTIVIFLFRQAFILSMIYKSEIPSILVVLYVIIIQIALLAVLPLIVKELIFNIIPTTTKTWQLVHAQVNRFYYMIWAIIGAIIILSNPYIGLSKLVWYVLSRLFITAVLIKLMFMAQNIIKKVSLTLFFRTKGDVVQERFNWGKTGYGLFLIFTFVLLIGLGILIGLQIWGWKISLQMIYEKGFRAELFLGDDGKPFTIISFLKILLYIFAGFGLSFAINKFVLRKIFDLLLVDAGVQNAVKSILKYLIVTALIVIGFYSYGLGTLVKWVLVTLTFSIGWIFKEPIADFAYYFVILIQRPLKIGDYIRVDEEVSGVVRKITPRSVIIRKKNSETVLVPNSKLISNPITNWNYISSVVAFNDIMITISYKEDPVKVKEVLFKILDQHPNILKSPKPIIRLSNFGEYGYEFLIRGFLSSHYTLDMWDIASDIRFAIVKSLKENNIEIAVPVRMMMSVKENERKEEREIK